MQRTAMRNSPAQKRPDTVASIHQKFTANFSFPVHFTRNLFSLHHPLFVDTVTRLEPDRRHQVLFVIDENVASAHPRLCEHITRYVTAHRRSLELLGDPVLVTGGEAVKNDGAAVLRLLERFHQLGVDRQSCVGVIGGGAVLDMVGYAAAITHRGIRVARMPTTVLSQNDSGVGVKCGINAFGRKNYIGAFAPPFAVINDETFLTSLSHRDKIAGLSEAVKVALVRDRAFFELLETNADKLATADPTLMAVQIRRSAEHHLEHIRTSGDPFETRSARPLDFGHWSAHKLESMTNYRLRHGEAVAIGIALDSIYSMKAGLLPQDRTERILTLLNRAGCVLWDDVLRDRDPEGEYVLLSGLEEFRQHLGGGLKISLLRDIGVSHEVSAIDPSVMSDSIRWLKHWHDLHREEPRQERSIRHSPLRELSRQPVPGT